MGLSRIVSNANDYFDDGIGSAGVADLGSDGGVVRYRTIFLRPKTCDLRPVRAAMLDSRLKDCIQSPMNISVSRILRSRNLRMSIAALALAIALALAAGSVACGGDPKSQAVPIVVTFNAGNPPPASLETGAFAAIAADVANDNKNQGVSFSCTPTDACGSFTPTSAGPSVPVCYLAPDAVPAGNAVTVTATSLTDPTKSVSANITIVSGAPNPCP